MVEILSAKKKHKGSFSIDYAKGVWKYGQKEFKIGGSRDCDYNRRYGVIGVYNRNLVEHLDTMVHAANRAVERRGNCLFSD